MVLKQILPKQITHEIYLVKRVTIHELILSMFYELVILKFFLLI